MADSALIGALHQPLPARRSSASTSPFKIKGYYRSGYGDSLLNALNYLAIPATTPDLAQPTPQAYAHPR